MNIRACAEHLLTYFSPEERSIPESDTYPGRHDAVQKAMNEALQELFGRGGAWVRKDERGHVLHAPTSVGIVVLNGSKEATISAADWQDWFAGCSIVIAGSNVDNQIRNASRNATLKFPHDGETSTLVSSIPDTYAPTTAIVYQDSIVIDDDVLEVLRPVRVDRRPLVPYSQPYDMQSGVSTEDFGSHTHVDGMAFEVANVAATAGTPAAFAVETWSPDDETPARLRMRIHPAPDSQCFLEYRAMLLPPRVTDILSAASLPVPFGWIETVFLPVAVKKLRGCPFWRGIIADDEVTASYQAAREALREAAPKQTGGIRFIPIA